MFVLDALPENIQIWNPSVLTNSAILLPFGEGHKAGGTS